MRGGVNWRESVSMAESEVQPVLQPSSLSRDELVVYYSTRGLRVKDIQSLLQQFHGHDIRYVAMSSLSSGGLRTAAEVV